MYHNLALFNPSKCQHTQIVKAPLQVKDQRSCESELSLTKHTYIFKIICMADVKTISKKARANILLDAETKRRVQLILKSENRTLTDLIEQQLTLYIQQQESKGNLNHILAKKTFDSNKKAFDYKTQISELYEKDFFGC